jgi:hypothetical protein
MESFVHTRYAMHLMAALTQVLDNELGRIIVINEDYVSHGTVAPSRIYCFLARESTQSLVPFVAWLAQAPALVFTISRRNSFPARDYGEHTPPHNAIKCADERFKWDAVPRWIRPSGRQLRPSPQRARERIYSLAR